MEPSILEYARFHGLSIDHRATHPLQYIIDIPSLPNVQDPPELFEIDASCGSLAPERLSVSKEAAALLSSIRKTLSEGYEFDESILPDTHRVRNLKIEIPLLRTDPELDLRDFRAQVIPDLAAEHLPFEKVDEELDEGFTWPLSYEDLYQQVKDQSEAEKPTFSMEALLYLQSTLASHKGHDGSWNLKDSPESSCRVNRVLPSSKPLCTKFIFRERESNLLLHHFCRCRRRSYLLYHPLTLATSSSYQITRVLPAMSYVRWKNK